MIQALLELFGGIFAFAGHITGGSSFPEPLSPEKEKDCIARLEAGDAEARRLLIEHNLRLVAHIAKKYTTPKRDADDVISIGVVGLIKAVSTFKPDKNTRLATYACRCIENEILMYFRSLRKQSQEVSLYDPIDNDSDGNAISLLDVISCEDAMLEQVDLSDRQHLLYRYLAQALDARERRILLLRYGLTGQPPMTQRQVAQHCGISRSYVSRIEKKALQKLADCFQEKNS